MKPWEELKDAFLQYRQLTLTLVSRYMEQYLYVLFNLLVKQISPETLKSRPGRVHNV